MKTTLPFRASGFEWQIRQTGFTEAEENAPNLGPFPSSGCDSNIALRKKICSTYICGK
jgi:hypothetical protein